MGNTNLNCACKSKPHKSSNQLSRKQLDLQKLQDQKQPSLQGATPKQPDTLTAGCQSRDINVPSCKKQLKMQKKKERKEKKERKRQERKEKALNSIRQRGLLVDEVVDASEDENTSQVLQRQESEQAITVRKLTQSVEQNGYDENSNIEEPASSLILYTTQSERSTERRQRFDDRKEALQDELSVTLDESEERASTKLQRLAERKNSFKLNQQALSLNTPTGVMGLKRKNEFAFSGVGSSSSSSSEENFGTKLIPIGYTEKEYSPVQIQSPQRKPSFHKTMNYEDDFVMSHESDRKPVSHEPDRTPAALENSTETEQSPVQIKSPKRKPSFRKKSYMSEQCERENAGAFGASKRRVGIFGKKRDQSVQSEQRNIFRKKRDQSVQSEQRNIFGRKRDQSVPTNQRRTGASRLINKIKSRESQSILGDSLSFNPIEYTS